MAKQHTKKQKKGDILYEKTLNIILIVLAVILAGFLLFKGGSALVKAVHLDGSLRVTEDAVAAQDGWLVKNLGTTASPRCFKFGEIAPIEGYTREVMTISSKYDQTYMYRAEEGTDGVEQLFVGIASSDIDTNPQKARDMFASTYAGAEISDVITESFSGRKAAYYTYSYKDPEKDALQQGLSYYIAAGDRCVFISAVDYAGHDLRAAVDKALAALKITR